MEKKLRILSDYQRFENDPRLKEMLDSALQRAGFSDDGEGELSDDDVDFLNAAGSQVSEPDSSKENDL